MQAIPSSDGNPMVSRRIAIHLGTGGNALFDVQECGEAHENLGIVVVAFEGIGSDA